MSDPARPPLLVLVGPTAVGKTAACLDVGRELKAEVVNADSVQVFKGLDIGSAKPSPADRALVPHHLVDVAEPWEEMSAARFAGLAQAAIAGIHSGGRRVLLAGGTGLYVRALLYGLAPAPAVDQTLRAELAGQWEALGGEALHARLAGMDPVAAARLHPADRQRVLRALEFVLQTGEPLSQRQAAHGFARARYPHLTVGLERPREEMNRRIEARCRQMWEQGLLAEVEGLLAAGVPPQAQSLRSLGYRQAVEVLTGGLGQEEALARMIQRTRAYAKRQLTWFRAIQGINWLSAEDMPGLVALARKFWLAEAILS